MSLYKSILYSSKNSVTVFLIISYSIHLVIWFLVYMLFTLIVAAAVLAGLCWLFTNIVRSVRRVTGTRGGDYSNSDYQTRKVY